MKYLFVTNINGTGESGIIDTDSLMVVCLCPKANSELILQALNMPVVIKSVCDCPSPTADSDKECCIVCGKLLY